MGGRLDLQGQLGSGHLRSGPEPVGEPVHRRDWPEVRLVRVLQLGPALFRSADHDDGPEPKLSAAGRAVLYQPVGVRILPEHCLLQPGTCLV